MICGVGFRDCSPRDELLASDFEGGRRVRASQAGRGRLHSSLEMNAFRWWRRVLSCARIARELTRGGRAFLRCKGSPHTETCK